MEIDVRVVLVSDSAPTPWTVAIERAIEQIGRVICKTTSELDQCSGAKKADLIIVDASTTQRTAQVIAMLRSVNRAGRIVVFTASPDWKEARDVLKAGALDYVPKSVQGTRLQEYLRTVLTSPSQRSVVEVQR